MTNYFIVRSAATDSLLVERWHKSTRQETNRWCSMCERNVVYSTSEYCALKRYISLSCFLADFPCATRKEGTMTGACDHLPLYNNVCANCSITKPSVKVMGIERPCDANLQTSENRCDVLNGGKV